MMTELIDLSGRRFGNLTAVERQGSHAKYAAWLCRCDCGQRVIVSSNYLLRGKKRSCGILGHIFVSPDRKTREKTGVHHRPEYRVWVRMKERCYDPKRHNFGSYGGRGIVVCDRWLGSFAAFFEDMGERPSSGHSIERDNNDGNYESSNCRWATMVEQRRNTRRTVYVERDGQLVKLVEFVEELGLSIYTVYSRVVKMGWDLDSALTIPVREKRRKISLED